MAKITETEIRRRLKKLEFKNTGQSPLIKRIGDQFEYTEDYIYVAYASALSGLSNGKITNQSDATDFQYGPYDRTGALMAYRGFFESRSIHQSGDPTDYYWESTSGQSGYNSSERYYTTSTELKSDLGNPTNPGTGVTWTSLSSGASIPSSAVWLAERHTTKNVTSAWAITAIAAYVSSTLMVPGSVITEKIAANAITTAKILNSAINADKIANNAVTVNKILDNSINSDKIANNAVTTAKILDDAIDTDKIAANAVSTNEIAANAITANEIQANTIGANEIAANTITAGEIAANAITATEIQAGAIGATEIAANAITASEIAANAITSTEIQANAIGANEIAANAITASEIAANAITSTEISAGAVTANEVAANAITSAKLVITGTGAITPSTIGGASQTDLNTTNSNVTTALANAATAQADASTAISDAAGAQSTADGKVRTFFANNAPTAEGTGDLWIDTDDGNKLYRWSGSAWTSVQDTKISTAITNAATAQSTADGKIDSYYTSTAPTGLGSTDTGDLWVDTGNGNKLYRWSGSAWVAVQDTAIAAAQSTADSKNTVFRQNNTPSALRAGDAWIDTNDSNKLYISTGTGTGNWVLSTDQTATRIYRQDAQPASGMTSGDIWIDTDDGNKMYVYSGSAWESAQDAAIATAQSTADSKVLPSGVAQAINDNSTTVDGSKITTGSIAADQIEANAITANKMDLDGPLTVANTADGSILWGKTDGADLTNSGLFIGNETVSSVRKQKLLMGSSTSFIWYDGDEVFLIGTTSAANDGSVSQVINPSDVANQTGVQVYQPSPIKPKVRIEMVSAGGGGAQGYSPSGANGGSGGTITMLVEKQNPYTPGTYTTRHTILATGGTGGGGGYSTNGRTGYTNYPNGMTNRGWGGVFVFHDHEESNPTTTTVTSRPNSWQVNVNSTSGFPSRGTLHYSISGTDYYWQYHTKTSTKFTGHLSGSPPTNIDNSLITLVYSEGNLNDTSWSDLPSSYGTVTAFESKDGGEMGEYADGSSANYRGGYGGSATVSNTSTRTTATFPTAPNTTGGDAYNDESSTINQAKTPQAGSKGVGGGGGGGQSTSGGSSGKGGGGGSGAYVDLEYTIVSNTDRIRVTTFGNAGAGATEGSSGNNSGRSGTDGIIRLIGAS